MIDDDPGPAQAPPAHPSSSRPFGYRKDPLVPPFDDRHPLLVYDGVCVLCSGFIRFVLRHDRSAGFRFAAAQSPLGQALYRHYGLDRTEFETNLLIADGHCHARMASFAAVMARLPWPWRALSVAGLLPRRLGDWLYDRIARNRYRWFGRTESCMVPDAAVRSRFLE